MIFTVPAIRIYANAAAAAAMLAAEETVLIAFSHWLIWLHTGQLSPTQSCSVSAIIYIVERSITKNRANTNAVDTKRFLFIMLPSFS